jgi:hypothetical protein
MTFGTETYRANGSTIMSGANKPGIFIENMVIAYSSASGSKTYSQIPAGSMYILIMSSGGQFSVTISDDGAGHAKLVWTKVSSTSPYLNSTAATQVLVFAKKLTQSETYGILLYNDDGDQLTDFNYPVPQYITTLQPAATPAFNSYCNGNDVVARHDHTVVLNSATTRNRFVVVNLPDSTSADIWYSCTSFVPAGSSNVTLTLTIVRPRGTAYQVPTLHVFALDGPTSGGGTYGNQYFKSDGSLVYDSSAENVSISAIQNIDYPPSLAVQTYPMVLPSTPGLAVPYYEQDDWVDYAEPDINGNIGYFSVKRGLMQRKGSTIYTKLYEIREDLRSGGNTFNSKSGLSPNFTLAIDISQQSPSSVTGTPPTSYQ